MVAEMPLKCKSTKECILIDIDDTYSNSLLHYWRERRGSTGDKESGRGLKVELGQGGKEG